MKKSIIMLLLPLCFAVAATGCTKTHTPVAIEGYSMSSVHDEFPVPEQAIEREARFGNPNILQGAEYELENIGGELGLYTPDSYLQEIKALGWTELEEERLGHVHFFKKDDSLVALEIHEDTIGVYEMKQDDAP